MFGMANDMHNLRGQSPVLKPDAANPRQVDAVASCFLFKRIDSSPSDSLKSLTHKVL